MAQYETLFILPPDSNPTQMKAVQDKLTGIISRSKGAIKLVEDWGIKKLAYPIRKQNRGHFVYVNYDAAPDSLSEVTRVFRIDENVLRFANVRLPDEYDYAKAKKTYVTESYDDYRSRRSMSGRPEREPEFEGGDEDMDFGGDEGAEETASRPVRKS